MQFKKNKNIFQEHRLVFNGAEKPTEAVSEAPEKQREKIRTIPQLLEHLEETKGVKEYKVTLRPQDNIQNISRKFGEEIGKQVQLSENNLKNFTAQTNLIFTEQFTQFRNTFSKETGHGMIDNATLLKYITGLTPPPSIKLEKSSGEWKFKFYQDGRELTPAEIKEIKVTGITMAQVRENVGAEKPKPKREEKVDIELNKEQIIREGTRISDTRNAEEARKRKEGEGAYIDENGVVNLKDAKETRNIRLTTLFPNAQEGDRLMITDKNEKSKSVKLLEGEWYYEDSLTAGKTKQRAKIFNGDKVVQLTKIDYTEEKPKAPQIGRNEFFITPEGKTQKSPTEAIRLTYDEGAKGTWNDIAKKIMEQYPQIKETGVSTTEYAKILKNYATETGYYWVIMPEKQVDAQQKALEETLANKREAVKRKRTGEKEREKRIDKAYAKYESYVKENKDIPLHESNNEAIGNEVIWNMEIWPIYGGRIKDAFSGEPFNKCWSNENELRDNMREALYEASFLQARDFNFEDIFDFFNKEGNLYQSLSKPGNTTLKGYKADIKAIEKLNKKIEKKTKEGETYTYTPEELRLLDKQSEIDNIARGSAYIFESLSFLSKSKRKPPRQIERVRDPNEPKYDINVFRQNVLDEENEPTTAEAKKKMQEYISDPQKWEKLWKSQPPIGNIAVLKNAVSRYPFSIFNENERMEKIRTALHPNYVRNQITMDSLLEAFNEKGELFRTKDNEPITDYEELVNEHNRLNKIAPGSEQFERMHQFMITSGLIYSAVRGLDADLPYVETFRPNELPGATLNEIFSPEDTGKHDVRGSTEGQRIAGGGLFTGGFLRWDFREELGEMDQLELTTSNATANTILRDQCGMNEGKIDAKKMENRLNDLLMKGIGYLLSRSDEDKEKMAPQIAKVMEQLREQGINTGNPPDTKTIYDQLKISYLTADKPPTAVQLNAAQKDLIRFGFIVDAMKGGPKVEVSSETANKAPEMIQLSENPAIRAIQMRVLQSNLPKDKQEKALKTIKENEGKIKNATKQTMIAALGLKLKDNFKGGVETVGVGTGIPIADGLMIMGGVSYNRTTNEWSFSAGPGGSWDLGGGASLNAGIGITNKGAFLAGAGISFTVKADPGNEESWDDTFTIGGMLKIDPSKPFETSGGIGLAFMQSFNPEANAEKETRERMIEKGYENVEKAQSIEEKASALKNIPGTTGKAIAEMAFNTKMSDEDLVKYYNENIRKHAKAEISAVSPLLTHAGVGIGVQLEPGQPPVFLPGVAFGLQIAGELVLFQRQNISESQFDEFVTDDMERQAYKKVYEEALKKAKKGQYGNVRTLTFTDVTLAGEADTGFRRIKENMPVHTEEGKAQMDPYTEDNEKAFREYQKELRGLGMNIEKTKSPPNMFELKINNVGNLEVYVDPKIQEKMGVFVTPDGRILVAANKNPKMVIKRFDKYYPRETNGNVKHTVVTISDEDFRTQEAIKSESDYYLDSTTLSQAGDQRYTLSLQAKGREKQTQYNLYPWDKNWKEMPQQFRGHFQTREFVNSDAADYREQMRINKEYADKVRERIGSANFDTINENNQKILHEHAVEFAKKGGPKGSPTYNPNYQLYRNLTTEGEKTKRDPKALETVIETYLTGKLGRIPSFEETQMFKIELFNLSMSEAEEQIAKRGIKDPEKILKEKEKIMRSRIEWAKREIYIPFFKKRINANNNPSGFTAEQLAEAYLAPIRTLDLAKTTAITLPDGTSLNVGVGTGGVKGTRPLETSVDSEKIKNHKLYESKDYTNALETGNPKIDYTIASILRESHRPVKSLAENGELPESKMEAFMRSPLTIRLLQLGVDQNQPALVKMMGKDNYEKIIECYKNYGKTNKIEINESSKPAVTKLFDIASKLSDAQEGKGATVMKVRLKDGTETEFYSIQINGVRLGIKTAMLKTGVYERCFNPSDAYGDQLIAISENIPYTMENNLRVYGSAAQSHLTSSFGRGGLSIGLGVVAPIKATPPPPPPPPRIPEEPIRKTGHGHPPKTPDEKKKAETPKSGGQTTERARAEKTGPQSEGGGQQPAPGRGEHPSKTQTPETKDTSKPIIRMRLTPPGTREITRPVKSPDTPPGAGLRGQTTQSAPETGNPPLRIRLRPPASETPPPPSASESPSTDQSSSSNDTGASGRRQDGPAG